MARIVLVRMAMNTKIFETVHIQHAIFLLSTVFGKLTNSKLKPRSKHTRASPRAKPKNRYAFLLAKKVTRFDPLRTSPLPITPKMNSTTMRMTPIMCSTSVGLNTSFKSQSTVAFVVVLSLDIVVDIRDTKGSCDIYKYTHTKNFCILIK